MTTTARNVFVVLWLAVQLLLPIRGFLWDKYETRGNFTWNMYSKVYNCQVRYLFIGEDGAVEFLDHKRYFNRPKRARMVYHRDSLPKFNSWLCEQLRREGRPGRVIGAASCTLNDEPRTELMDQSVDMCTDPDFAVIDED